MDTMNKMQTSDMMNKMTAADMMKMLGDMKAMCRCHDCSTFMGCSMNSQEGLFCGMGGKISCQQYDMGCMPSKMDSMPSDMNCMSSKKDMPSKMGCMSSKMDMPPKMECMCKSCSIASDMGMKDGSFCMNK